MAERTTDTYPPTRDRSDEFLPGWVRVARRDTAAPEGEFPRCRVLTGGHFNRGDGKPWYNLAVTLHEKPPREWPPLHVTPNTAGLCLDPDDVLALRDALTTWLTHWNLDPTGKHPAHAVTDQFGLPVPPTRDASPWRRWKGRRACHRRGGHWWHPVASITRKRLGSRAEGSAAGCARAGWR